jgi:hypothetical protein
MALSQSESQDQRSADEMAMNQVRPNFTHQSPCNSAMFSQTPWRSSWKIEGCYVQDRPSLSPFAHGKPVHLRDGDMHLNAVANKLPGEPSGPLPTMRGLDNVKHSHSC